MRRTIEIVGAAIGAFVVAHLLTWRLLELAMASYANGQGVGAAIEFFTSTISILVTILCVNFAAWVAVGLYLIGKENDAKLG